MHVHTTTHTHYASRQCHRFSVLLTGSSCLTQAMGSVALNLVNITTKVAIQAQL